LHVVDGEVSRAAPPRLAAGAYPLEVAVGRWKLKFHKGWIDPQLSQSLRHELGETRVAAVKVAEALLVYTDILSDSPQFIWRTRCQFDDRSTAP